MSVCNLITSERVIGQKKTEYTINFVTIQGWFLGKLEVHRERCVLLAFKNKTFNGILLNTFTCCNPIFQRHENEANLLINAYVCKHCVKRN